MIHRITWREIRPFTFILALLLFVCLYVFAQDWDPVKPVPYVVLDDPLQASIKIGVASEIGEKELEATLGRAADDHQNDAARDLLFSDYLWIEGYLLRGDKQSQVPAGKLRRYIQPKQPAKQKDWFDWLPVLVIFEKYGFRRDVPNDPPHLQWMGWNRLSPEEQKKAIVEAQNEYHRCHQ